MTKRIADLVCFDNDGTLFRSEEVANPAIQREFVRFVRERGLDLPPPSDARILELTGSPGPVFYQAILPPELAELSGEFRARCIEEEVREVLARGRFFEGIEELLTELRAREVKLALVTNGGARYVGAVAERLDYARKLDGVYYFGKDGLGTKADMIRSAIRDLGAETTIMVGDRAADREAAAEVGIPFIGCAFGYGHPNELAGVERLAKDPLELARMLLET